METLLAKSLDTDPKDLSVISNMASQQRIIEVHEFLASYVKLLGATSAG